MPPQVLSRDGTLVVRPDSGPPALIDLGLLQRLGAALGQETNKKGYFELPSQVRMIQGDGISYTSLLTILALLVDQKWSANNIAFGSGGGLLQKLNRDTQKCAFKCSYAVVGGKSIDVQKSPVHAPGKRSKKGRMTVNVRDGKVVTLTGDDACADDDVLETVFENGTLTREYSWEEVRSNAAVDMAKYEEWGPAVAARAEELLSAYKTSEQYQKDVAVMQIAQPDYVGPY
jgi:nicotinamide phosphoribosyltransferase